MLTGRPFLFEIVGDKLQVLQELLLAEPAADALPGRYSALPPGEPHEEDARHVDTQQQFELGGRVAVPLIEDR